MTVKSISELVAAGALTGNEIVEVSQLSTTVVKTATTLSALASDNSYNDSGSGFVAAGFALGDRVNVTGFTGNAANNIYTGRVTALTAGKMTIGGTDGDVIVDDAAGESVTITKWNTRRLTIQELADLAALSLNLASQVSQSGTPTTTSVGFLGAPQIADQDDYTLALTDAGGSYYHVSATPHTLTIPDNASVAFPIGTIIDIGNENGAGDLTIAITSDTLRWGDSTGTRTLAANGNASLIKRTATLWRLTGEGIS